MSVQYYQTVPWDPTLIDVEVLDSTSAPPALRGLVKYAYKITMGSPTIIADKYAPAALVAVIGGNVYRNQGTSQSPSWVTI